MPLLLDPGRAEKTLHLFGTPDWAEGELTNRWQVSLGPAQYDPPPAPTWRDYLSGRGYRFDIADDLARIYRETSTRPEQLDELLPDTSWGSIWEYDESPQARAYTLLKDLGLGCELNRPGEKAGCIEFIEWGYHPGSSERLVELRDDLSVLLLQARLIEHNLPIQLVIEN